MELINAYHACGYQLRDILLLLLGIAMHVVFLQQYSSEICIPDLSPQPRQINIPNVNKYVIRLCFMKGLFYLAHLSTTCT